MSPSPAPSIEEFHISYYPLEPIDIITVQILNIVHKSYFPFIMQTILGSTGAIGTELAKVLPSYTDQVRLVSRHPKAVLGNETLFPADLLNPADADRAVAGSDIVYLTVGLPYDIKIWARDWPILIGNVLAACEKHGAKLVFFDNVYPYGKVEGWMTEETPIRPSSRKGEARAQIDRMILEAVAEGKVEAILARAADFYGHTPLSFAQVMVFERLAKGKSAQWFVNADKRHTFTHIVDAAKGTALLGNTPDAYNQTWHLPSDMSAPTGRAFVEMVAAEFGAKPAVSIMPKWMVRLLGVFVPYLGESVEMLYQNEMDYLFSSQKFLDRFGLQAISYEEGIRQTIAAMRQPSAPATVHSSN